MISADQIGRLDQQIGPKLPGLTPRKATELARKATITIDADAALGSHPGKSSPAEQFIAAYNALALVAQQQRAAGDTRKTSQVRADVAVERRTGTVQSIGGRCRDRSGLHRRALLGHRR